MWIRTLQTLTATMLILALPAHAVSLDDVKAKGTLSVSLYKDFPPYSYLKDGKQTGVDVDLARALADKLGVESDIRLVGADENVEDDLRNNVWKGHYLGSGVTDVMLHMPYDREFSKKVDEASFVAPYQLEKVVFAFNTDKVGKQPTIANFMSEPIGVEIDTLSDFYLLQAMQGAISRNVRHYANLTKAAEALKSGEISGIMGPRGELEGILATRPANIQMQSLVTPGLARGSWAMGIAVKADIKGNLGKEVDKAMAELVKDGTVKKVFEEHKLTYQPPAEASNVTTSQ
ncbi:substrate-binding periplasmic protein [Thiothrix nivea]|uniref:Amino acid ABC transporter substrate-binding protein, PAAT family n=1 Tax=Thiothrix nivea (strain ATCC 35100 / DSM 5205 / JP2) TaxID=870187 RepID=A0A656HCI7_THINJ|nr:ABC transporter substrate-binding protein [Thiothrix nivea]EIJ34871.1 amino acid ABC transporter substrate-binding protein, PAAT family [Thiothrix nivea DSM 5205]